MTGLPPKAATITVTQDPGTCGATRVEDAWSVAADGAVENVVVYLVDIKAGKKMDFPAKPVIDQKGCHYQPHTQIIAKGSELQVTNSDPILHNIHSYLGTTTVLNLAEPKQGMVIPKKITKAGGMTLKCDIDDFMRGAIFTAETPYAVLTGRMAPSRLRTSRRGPTRLPLFTKWPVPRAPRSP